MTENEKQLFAKALREAMIEKRTAELEACTEDDGSCTKAHLRKISNIIGANVAENRIWIRPKYVLVAILISAALLLSGCSVYVMSHCSKIRAFFEEVFEKFARVTYDDNGELYNDGTIDEVYTLSYIPEGYELEEEDIYSSSVYYKWSNVERDFIVFEQFTFNGGAFGINVENSDTVFIEYQNMEIYYQISADRYKYAWSDGKYVMTLVSTVPLTEENLYQIIDGVVVKES